MFLQFGSVAVVQPTAPVLTPVLTVAVLFVMTSVSATWVGVTVRPFERSLSPTALKAVTVSVYLVPLVSPLIT